MAVIFPNIEAVVVAYLKSVLSNVYVSVKKPAPDATQPDRQVIIMGAYQGESNRVLKTASLTIDVYATDYIEATNLALLVESKIRDCTGNVIKRAEVLMGPVRTTEAGEMERRSLDVELTVKGDNA